MGVPTAKMEKLLLEELQVIKVQEELQQRVGRSLRLPSLSLEPSDLQYMQQCFMHNLQRVESPICQLKVVQWLKKLVIFFHLFYYCTFMTSHIWLKKFCISK